MLNIVAIYGSPRRKQNSDVLLDKALGSFGDEEADITRLYASKADIRPCMGCESCYKTGRCVIRDDMRQVYDRLNRADIVITATPVYFYTVPSELKKIIDRCQAVWSGKYMAQNSLIDRKRRLGYIICTAGAPDGPAYFDCTVKVLDLFYKCINTSLEGTLLVSNVDAVHARDRKALLDEARNIGLGLKGKLKE